MRIVIAGGHGQIARQFGRLVAAAGHQPVGMIRKPEQIPDLQEDGIEPALIDLESTDVAEMTEIVRGADAVVFAAGGGADGNAKRKETVDKGAAIMLADAAQAASDADFAGVASLSATFGIKRRAIQHEFVATKSDNYRFRFGFLVPEKFRFES